MQIVGTVLGILFLSAVMVALAVLAFGPFVLDELAERKKRAGSRLMPKPDIRPALLSLKGGDPNPWCPGCIREHGPVEACDDCWNGSDYEAERED